MKWYKIAGLMAVLLCTELLAGEKMWIAGLLAAGLLLPFVFEKPGRTWWVILLAELLALLIVWLTVWNQTGSPYYLGQNSSVSEWIWIAITVGIHIASAWICVLLPAAAVKNVLIKINSTK